VALVLEARDVTKRVKDGEKRREILRGVTLEVASGEVVVVRGKSGCGKTTLLGVLGGMLLPTSGEVWLEGEAVSRLRDRHRAEVRRRKVGYLFQDFALVPGMTALANVMLPLVPDGMTGKDGEKAAEKALDRLGVMPRARDLVDGLSGGEKQRVALARAAREPSRVLLLDEPTAHLDGALAERLLSDLAAIAEGGAALVMASHDPRVTESVRVKMTYTLDDGALS
jgi:putative ABC transport system ATP-binding protein